MDSYDTPGSPRKKLKLKQPTSIHSTMDPLKLGGDTTAEQKHPAFSNTKMGETIETEGQQIPIDSPKGEHPPTNMSFKKVEIPTTAAPPAPDQALEQINKEKACGITELVSPDLLGFTGILKKRYTDFMVNEILPSGEVVHLTNLKAPKKEYPKELDSKQNASDLTNEREASKDTQSPQKGSQNLRRVLDSKSETSVPQAVPQVTTHQDTHKVKKHEEFKHEEIPPPHQCTALPHLDMESKANTSPRPSPSKETRTRQQFHLRHTAQGWAEFDKEKEDREKEAEVLGNVIANVNAKLEPSSSPLKKESVQPKDEVSPFTRIEEPRPDYTPKASSQAQWQAYADPNGETSDGHKLSDEDKAVLLSYFTEPVVDAIRALYDRVLNSPRRATRDYGTVKSAVIDRQLRTKIHKDVRRIFQSRLETMTDNDGAMVVSAMPPSSNSYNSRAPAGRNERGQAVSRGNRQGSREYNGGFANRNWQELGGEFLHFTLYKENKDTMECISWLSKVLKLGPRAFEFAGTKDRRAVSVQRVSVYRQTISRMVDAGKSLRQANIGDYEYRPHALQLGELTGNEFTITLRDCTFDNSDTTATIVEKAHSIVSNAVKNLVERGFINYYGLQRFGTFSTGTDDIGVKLLQGDFKGAVEAILHYTPESLAASQDPMSADDRLSRDDKARSHAIHSFQTSGKAQRALADLPRKFSAESAIIRHLGSRPNQAQDYLGAIQSIQRNLRLMYVHAYQSLVWNMVASKRWSMYGDSVVEDDLVLVNEHVDKEKAPPTTEEADDDGEPIIRPAAEDRSTNVEDIYTRARPLSKEEANSGDYTIFDVVLPTPGFDILYPANEMEKFYEDFMASPKGGGLDPHDMRRPQKDFSLSGSYRKVLAKPGKDFSFEIKTYENDDEQFVETDMDRLSKAREASKSSQHGNGKENANITATNPSEEQVEKQEDSVIKGEDLKDDIDNETKDDSDDDPDLSGGVPLNHGKKIAVVLKVQLGSSQYATMALRELMKAGGVKNYKPDFEGVR